MLAMEATIPATDEGLLRGDGVFEVIRIYDGRPYALEQHLQRLERSASNLRLPIALEAVRADAHRLLAHAGRGPDPEALRIVITRGGRQLLLTEPLTPGPERIRLGSITYSPTWVLDGVKSPCYTANMLASRLASERGFDEALLVTPHGRVLEAPTAALFWIKDGTILTPPLDDHILGSITRATVIELSDAIECACTLDDLFAADEVFLSSTTLEVQPVSAVDSRNFDDVSPLTARINANTRQSRSYARLVAGASAKGATGCSHEALSQGSRPMGLAALFVPLFPTGRKLRDPHRIHLNGREGATLAPPSRRSHRRGAGSADAAKRSHPVRRDGSEPRPRGRRVGHGGPVNELAVSAVAHCPSSVGAAELEQLALLQTVPSTTIPTGKKRGRKERGDGWRQLHGEELLAHDPAL